MFPFKLWPNDPVKGSEKTAALNKRFFKDSNGLYYDSCRMTRDIFVNCFGLYILWTNQGGDQNLTTSSHDV